MRTDLHKVVDNLWKTGIGFDRVFDFVPTAGKPTFPPYNIRKTDENTYVIEIAVAGFSIGDIEITLDKNLLHVKSKGHDQSKDIGTLIYQGFAYRGFERTYTLSDYVDVKGAEMINGILKIYLENLLADESKPKRINITAPDAKTHPQLLNEDSVI